MIDNEQTQNLPHNMPEPAPDVPAQSGFNPVLLVFLVFPVAALIIAVVTGSSGTNRVGIPPEIAVTSDTLIGRNAPDFEVESLTGSKIRLADLRGKPVFLNFWAVSCAPCRVEMPVFQAFLDGKILGDAHILTVNKGDDSAAIQGFFREITVNLPTGLDRTGRVTDLYRVINLPITYVIDKNGVVMGRHIGVMSADDMIAYLDKMNKVGSGG
jgi:thiol-disulfide isomerase/thioredoxin